MQKSLHCCCQKHCSLDAKNTALAVTEITALLVTVYSNKNKNGCEYISAKDVGEV